MLGPAFHYNFQWHYRCYNCVFNVLVLEVVELLPATLLTGTRLVLGLVRRTLATQVILQDVFLFFVSIVLPNLPERIFHKVH